MGKGVESLRRHQHRHQATARARMMTELYLRAYWRYYLFVAAWVLAVSALWSRG